jgi:hypothetical protein
MKARAQMLNDVIGIIGGEREQDYGTPEENFARIAELWTSAFDRNFSAKEVAVAMILLKIAREQSSDNIVQDNWTDIAGYAACAYEIDNRKLEKE